ncbi:hypothetical protein DPMN_021203 [Dreissena polymorpha]|uniref:Uncharacterized protein n=1 Tax=Dreissena polymorpha TaxID=45954 RepID=A0A9D4NNR3_DREPO|nr:hypothetical protein DPMN_021203 [Dreissena polymorpha]
MEKEFQAQSTCAQDKKEFLPQSTRTKEKRGISTTRYNCKSGRKFNIKVPIQKASQSTRAKDMFWIFFKSTLDASKKFQ